MSTRTHHAVTAPACTSVALHQRLLSLREAVVLAGIDGKEKEVRNDLSRGVLPEVTIVSFRAATGAAHLCFDLAYVPTFAALYGSDLADGTLRRAAFKAVYGLLTTGCTGNARTVDRDSYTSLLNTCRHAEVVEVDDYWSINIARACHEATPRVGAYVRGLERVEERDDVLGGAAVFRDTRLSVAHIGKMAERGVSIAEILEGYPSLSEEDVEFARLYYRARPPVGRPRANAGVTKYDTAPC